MNLKPYQDRARADSEELARLKNEVDTLFNNGTDEGIQAAIDLQPQLEAAQNKANESDRLYITMRNGDATPEAAALFSSANNSTAEDQAEKSLTLEAFNAMPPKDRMKYVHAGGLIAG